MSWWPWHFDPHLSFRAHLEDRASITSKKLITLSAIKSYQNGIPVKAAVRFFESIARPAFSYALPAFTPNNFSVPDALIKHEHPFLVTIAGAHRTTPTNSLYAALGIMSADAFLEREILLAANHIPYLPRNNPIFRSQQTRGCLISDKRLKK